MSSALRLRSTSGSPAGVREVAVAEALFASTLPANAEVGSADAVVAAIATSRTLGRSRCSGIMAAEYGYSPEGAAARMRWARRLASFIYPFVPV